MGDGHWMAIELGSFLFVDPKGQMLGYECDPRRGCCSLVRRVDLPLRRDFHSCEAASYLALIWELVTASIRF